MTRFIILVSLLAVQFSGGLSEDVVFAFGKDDDGKFVFSPPDNVVQCKVQTNRDLVYEYEPNSRGIGDSKRLISAETYYGSKTCSFNLKNVVYDDVGEWTVTVYHGKDKYSIESSTVYNIRVYIGEKRKIQPNTINVYGGEYARIQLPEIPDDIDECNVTNPQGVTANILYDKLEDVEHFGKCGVWILVNASGHEGKWKLSALANQTLYQGQFELVTVEEKSKDAGRMTIYFARGEQGRIGTEFGASFCQLVQPNGVSLPMIAGDCFLDLDVVTAQHEGTWVARYGLSGKVTTDEAIFDVVTYEVQNLNGTVSRTEDDKILLSCRYEEQTRKTFQYCNFIRPDGVIINVSPGVSNGRYSSRTVQMPNAMFSKVPIECSIAIESLEPVDYGTWKCTIGFHNKEKISGALLQVTSSNENSIKTHGEDMYVKKGDPFAIKCNASATLRYCWLRSPNGTMFSVVEGKKAGSKLALPYAGNSLLLGECAAKIEAADVTDGGKWSCFMGVFNETEVEATVSVTVTDSYLVATSTEILASKGIKPVLSCHVLPQLMNKAVDYCRWIRPDGQGIYNSRSNRYITESSTSDCKLTITGNNFPEDIGRWTCVAGLAGSGIEEAWAYVDLRYESMEVGTLIAIIIGACVLLTITACAFILINIRNRRRSLPKDPPAYTPEAYLPPKSLNPKLALPLDYKY